MNLGKTAVHGPKPSNDIHGPKPYEFRTTAIHGPKAYTIKTANQNGLALPSLSLHLKLFTHAVKGGVGDHIGLQHLMIVAL